MTTDVIERTPTSGIGRRIGFATAIAVVGNLIVFFVSNALIDGSLAATGPGMTVAEEIPAAAVIVASILPVALGVLFLTLRQRVGRLGWGIAVVAAVAIVSIGGPISSAPDTGSAIGLSLMHLVAGGATIAPFRN